MGHEDAEQGTITVLLADDNLIVREGVRGLIERHGDCAWSEWQPTTTR